MEKSNAAPGPQPGHACGPAILISSGEFKQELKKKKESSFRFLKFTFLLTFI